MKTSLLRKRCLIECLFLALLAACSPISTDTSTPESTMQAQILPTDIPTKDPSTATPPPMIAGGTWITKADMPTARWQLSTCVVDGKIYAIGGAGPTYEALNTVEVYDPTTDTWTEKSSMLTARESLTTSVVNGKIYAIGGLSSSSTSYMSVEVFSTVEEYDPATDTWTAKSPMPTARGFHHAHVVDGKIYVFGGTKDVEPIFTQVLTVEVYDPSTDTWTEKSDLRVASSTNASSMVDGKIYFFGGRPEAQKVFEFDLVTETWTQISSMSSPRRGLTASVLDGKIYIIGGYEPNRGSGGIADIIEVFDPATSTWAAAPVMPTARFGAKSSVVDGNIYVIGGSRSFPTGTIQTVEVFQP